MANGQNKQKNEGEEQGSDIDLAAVHKPEGQAPEEGREFPLLPLLGLVALALLGLAIWFLLDRGERVPSETETVREEVLTPPEPGEEETYAQKIAEAAVRADVLTLGAGCSMDPLVLELTANDILTIRNEDSVQHTVSFEDNNFFSVSAGSDRTLNLMQIFGKGEGIYRYRCSDQSFEENVGVLYIVSAG